MRLRIMPIKSWARERMSPRQLLVARERAHLEVFDKREISSGVGGSRSMSAHACQ